MAILDIHINDGFVAMVDGSLVYHRGFGERRTALNDPKPALAMNPRVITADGRVVSSRTYPLSAPPPPKGRPQPLRPDAGNKGVYFVRRGHWASYFPERTLIAETGSTIQIRVHNNLSQQHELRFHRAGTGGADVGSGPLPRDKPSFCSSGRRCPVRTCSPIPAISRGNGPWACTARWWSSIPATRGGLPPVRLSSSGSGCGCARTSIRSGASERAPGR